MRPSSESSVPAAPEGSADTVAQGLSVEMEGELNPFLNALWRRLHSEVPYPDSFVRNRSQGVVRLQIEVDHRGKFTGRIREVHGDSPGLMSYATALSLVVLERELPPSLWRPENERWWLALEYRFQIKVQGADPITETSGMGASDLPQRLKNFLLLPKVAYAPPYLNQVVQEVTSRYFPPIFVLPGGFVFIDLVRTYELIQNLANRGKRPDRYERRDISDGIERERWRTIVHQRKQ